MPLTYIIFIIFTLLAFFISGINNQTILLSLPFALLASTLGLLHLFTQSKKIIYPKYSGFLLAIFLVFNIYLIFLNDRINAFYSTIILGQGIIFFFIFSQLENSFKIIKILLLFLTGVYSLLLLASVLLPIDLTLMANLFFGPPQREVRHWDVGSLWAFTLTVLIASNWGKLYKRKLALKAVMFVGLIFLAISNARSAVLSLASGILYILLKSKLSIKSGKKLIFIGFVGIVAVFIYTSLFKTTLFSRPFFIQSVASVPKYPFGVGVGNFDQIARDYYLHYITTQTDKSTSLYTHNIYLEMLSGLGLFSIIPLVFLLLIVKELLKVRSKIKEGALLTAIFLNFMVDYSYTIPSLVWIFFMALGAFLKEEGTT